MEKPGNRLIPSAETTYCFWRKWPTKRTLGFATKPKTLNTSTGNPNLKTATRSKVLHEGNSRLLRVVPKTDPHLLFSKFHVFLISRNHSTSTSVSRFFKPCIQSLGHQILLGPRVNTANLPLRRSFHDPEDQILRQPVAGAHQAFSLPAWPADRTLRSAPRPPRRHFH